MWERAYRDPMRGSIARASALDKAGLALGALALAVAAFAPLQLGRFTGLPLLTSLTMVWGVIALLRVVYPEGDRHRADSVLVALTPYLAAGILVRLLAGDPGASMAVALHQTALPEVMGLLAGIGTYWAADAIVGRERPALHAGLAGWVLASALLLGHVVLKWPVVAGEAYTLGLTAVLLATALVVQWGLGSRARSPLVRSFALGGALAATGAQLLDGIVSTLAVRDPFGWLERTHGESVALSAFLIDLAGPAYPLVKWGIALLVVGVLERAEQKGEQGHWTNRFLVLLVVAFLGMGPGLFSAMRVLG